MFKRFVLAIMWIAIIATSPRASIHAQQRLFAVDFSADQFAYEAGHPDQAMNVGKLYVGKGRMRRETHTAQVSVVTLIDPARGQMWQLMPERKMAVDMGASFRQMGEMMGANIQSMQTLKPTDPNNPCADSKYVKCQKVGTETINGRSVQKWEFTSTGMGRIVKSYQWIDPKLYIAIKREDDHGGMELRNIKEGPQLDTLFEVPADYRKMTPQDMGKSNNASHPQ